MPRSPPLEAEGAASLSANAPPLTVEIALGVGGSYSGVSTASRKSVIAVMEAAICFSEAANCFIAAIILSITACGQLRW